MFEPKKQAYGLPVTSDRLVPAQSRSDYFNPYQEPVHPDAFEEEGGFDPLKLLLYVVHYRWIILALLSTGIASGVLFTWMQTPLYRATGNIEILTEGAKVIQDLEVISQVNDIRAFETARLKMLSRDLARRVVFELNLADNERFLAPMPSFSLLNLVNRVFRQPREASGVADLPPEQRQAMAIGRVQAGLSANLIRNTNMLSVSYSHPDPKIAAEVVNQVAKSFIDQGVDKRGETSDLARQFIEERVRDTKAKLQASEQALVDYAKKEGITLNGSDASLVTDNISQLNAALSEAIQQRLESERYLKQVEDGNSSTLPEVFESKSIGAAKEKIGELKATYQEKLAALKPGFPEMQRLQAQIKELQRQIAQEVASIAQSVEIKHQQALEKETAIKKELAGLEIKQSEFRDKNIKYTILKREVDSSRLQYESLINKQNDLGVGAELRTRNASIVDEAQTPGAPFSPNLKRNLMMSLAMFGALAAGIIYLIELLNNTFSVPDQIETELKLPVLGVIPRVAESGRIEEFANTKSSVSEAYRSLRTSIQFAGAEGALRTLLVTSAMPSEGKSTTVYKLAQDFAALGKKVLVIDADMRRPNLHRVFNTDNSIGLSNLLSNVVRQGEVLSIFRATSTPNLTFMSAGTIPPNPADLLVSQKMAMTLHFCTRKYDLVIIDSPPVMGLSDAPILSRQADATLLVVSSKQVTRKAAKSAMARLKSAGGNIAGAALTKFSVNQLDYNYAYRYMQYGNYYNYESDVEKLAGPQEPGTEPSSMPGRRRSSLLSRLFRGSKGRWRA